MSTNISSVNPKLSAVAQAVNENIVRDGMKIGIGSGSTMLLLLSYLESFILTSWRSASTSRYDGIDVSHIPFLLVNCNTTTIAPAPAATAATAAAAAAASVVCFKQVVLVSTSHETTQAIVKMRNSLEQKLNNEKAGGVTFVNPVSLSSLEVHPVLDVAFDGADEVDSNLNVFKGGGSAITLEKLVATRARRWIVVVDYTKLSQSLGQKHRVFVVDVIRESGPSVMSFLSSLSFPSSPSLKLSCQYRQGGSLKSGSIISDTLGHIIEAKITPTTSTTLISLSEGDLEALNQVKMLSGVVETGLFYKIAAAAYVGQQDGKVTVITKPSQRKSML